MSACDLEREYEDNVGRPPQNLPNDHPDRWQWEYRGTKAERDELAQKMGLEPEPDEQIHQDEALF